MWARYLEALSHRSAVLYQPREKIAGGNEPPAPRVLPGTELLDPRALDEAARYAGEHGAQALIISRHDHIVFERYWHGSSFGTLIDAGTFAPLLAALAIGHAVAHRQLWPDAPIGVLLPEWAQDPRGAITVRKLLQTPAASPRPGPRMIRLRPRRRAQGAAGSRRRDRAGWSRPPTRSCWRWCSSALRTSAMPASFPRASGARSVPGMPGCGWIVRAASLTRTAA